MSLSFDPQALPVVACDAHLPAVAPEVLRAQALRTRFLNPPAWAPEIEAERPFSDRPAAHAAVLLPLVQRAELMVLLTQRTAHLNDHPGQISFPGGRTEPDDAHPRATALRETQEEIGLASRHLEVLGELPTYTTGTRFIVTPVVALVQPPFELQADPFEVAEVFEVPLAFLMNPAHHRWHEVDMAGRPRRFLSMPWDGRDAQGQPRRYFVWGATAAMLRNFYRFLSA
jgi:8-oxo-dGTP pyrophosphatase MutT (NUDIX family)